MPHALENEMLNILLADDDADERYFFAIALNELLFGKPELYKAY